MTLALIVWLVMTALPGLADLGIGLAFGFGVLLVVGGITAIDYGSSNAILEWTKKHLKWAIPVMLLALFTPNKETAWYMVGAYAAQTVVQSDAAHELGADTYDLLKDLIKKSREFINSEQSEQINKKLATSSSKS